MSPDSLHPSPEELFAYRDGELPGERRSLIEAHVLGCSQCRARIDEMSRAEGDLRSRPDDVDDAYYERMTESVMARVGAKAGPKGASHPAPHVERRRPETEAAEETTRRSSALPWLGVAGSVAAAAAVILVVVMLAQRQSDWVRAPRPGVLGETRERAAEGRAGSEPPAANEAPARRETLAARPPAEAKTKAAAGASNAPEAGAKPVAPAMRKDMEASSGALGVAESSRSPAAAAAPQKIATQNAGEALGDFAQKKDNGAAGEEYDRVVRAHGLPPTWNENVGREALLGAEGPLRSLYQGGRAGPDSARVRLYLAEAERLRLAGPSDSAAVDRILHHYWRAIRLAGDDAALRSTALKRLVEFQKEVGERP